jgi:hydroxyquinol 1,2-dioxygenase
MDGPVGDLISQTEISHYRPAHVHFIVLADGYKPVITHLFEQGAEYIDTDVVYGTIAELVTPIETRPAGLTPTGEMSDVPFKVGSYDFILVPDALAGRSANDSEAHIIRSD